MMILNNWHFLEIEHQKYDIWGCQIVFSLAAKEFWVELCLLRKRNRDQSVLKNLEFRGNDHSKNSMLTPLCAFWMALFKWLWHSKYEEGLCIDSTIEDEQNQQKTLENGPFSKFDLGQLSF